MLQVFHELCAGIFGQTRRERGILARVLAIAFALALVVSLRLAWRALPLLVGFFAIAAASAFSVRTERTGLWRTACLPLDDPRQMPERRFDPRGFAETFVALRRLAFAVDEARRGRYAEAGAELGQVDHDLLLPEEAHLLQAVRAMVSLGIGDRKRAAAQAVEALPTGSDDLDQPLARAMIAESWKNARTLRAIDAAWARAGVERGFRGSMPRLRQLLRVRVDDRVLRELPPTEARDLSTEARAIGDDELAARLEGQARASAYR